MPDGSIMTLPAHMATYDGLNWSAKIRPIFDENGRKVPRDIASGVYRDDDDTVIGVAGRKYTPIQHHDLIDGFQTACLENGIDLAPVERTVQVLDRGAKMRTTYLFRKHIVEPKVGDTMYLKADILNSHNLTWACRVNWSYHRLVCLNGMTRPDFTAGTYGKHTSGFSIDTMMNQVNNAITMIGADEGRFARYARTPVTDAEARWFFEETIARRPKPFDGSWVYERKVEMMMEYFAHEDQTVWGVYNALTRWQTHHETKRGQAHNVLVNRETEVAKALRSPAFRAIENA